MSEASLPFCADCSVNKVLIEAPEIAYTVPVLQVAGYIDEFEDYFHEYLAESAREKHEIATRDSIDAEDEYDDPDYDPLAANSSFVESAADTRDEIVEYLDLLPTGVSPTTLLALGECAHMIANGDCYFTGSLPRFKEVLTEGNS